MTEQRVFAWTRETKRDKATATTVAANAIMAAERGASDKKVAKLKMLRLARDAEEVPPTSPARKPKKG